MRTPALRSFSTSSRFSSSANHSSTLRAMIGPTPSTPAMSSSVAVISPSMDGNASAITRATVEPTWRMFSATSSRHSGRFLDSSMEDMRFSIDLSLNPGSEASWSRVMK